MAIRYKGDILGQLKEKGYSSARLRKERIFGERTMQEFRSNGVIPYKSIDRLCSLLNCQPGDIMEYIPDDEREESQIYDEVPNAETIAAMEEIDQMIRTGSGQHFKGSAEEFFAMLDAEDDGEEDALS